MVAQGAALWRSTDSGSSWTPVATGTGSTPILALAGAGDGARLWAATSGRGVAWSDNQGASFSPGQAATAIPLVVLDLGLDGVDPNTLYAASGGQGLLVSRDAGATWTLANAGLPTLELLAVAAHPQRAGEVYIGGREGVFMSRDHGLSWQALNNGLINKNATALQFDLSLPDALFVGLEGGGIWYLDTRP
jgi:xyloglucan-specific exo-beta-1,4-glucanase